MEQELKKDEATQAICHVAACRSIMIMFFRWPNSKSMGQVVSSGEACPADEGAEERSSDSGDMYMQGLGYRILI